MAIDTILMERSPGELRAAMLDDGVVWQVDHHRDAAPARLGAIYLGRVRRLDPGANAGFVALGDGADGFLRARDVARMAGGGGKQVRINRLIQEGTAFPVQITGEAMGNKGPSLTSRIRLAGRYLDYRPGGDGIALPDGVKGVLAARIETALAGAREAGEGVVVRALALAEEVTADALVADLVALRTQWAAIAACGDAASVPALLDPGPDAVSRVLGEHGHGELAAIFCAEQATLGAARAWCARFAPALEGRVALADAGMAAFEEYGVEAAIGEALAPRLAMAGGGELVFEPGETLTAIDINSASRPGHAGRASRDVNLAAMPEIARQLRLRALAGAIVIDALKMPRPDDRRTVMKALRDGLADDPATCHVLGLSALGLVEMTRSRRAPTLAQRMLGPAPGPAPRPDAVAYDALRRLLREGTAHPGGGWHLAAAPGVIAALGGILAPAAEAAGRQLGAPIALVAEVGWPVDRVEFVRT